MISRLSRFSGEAQSSGFFIWLNNLKIKTDLSEGVYNEPLNFQHLLDFSTSALDANNFIARLDPKKCSNFIFVLTLTQRLIRNVAKSLNFSTLT